jgi:hypothetical protein
MLMTLSEENFFLAQVAQETRSFEDMAKFLEADLRQLGPGLN